MPETPTEELARCCNELAQSQDELNAAKDKLAEDEETLDIITKDSDYEIEFIDFAHDKVRTSKLKVKVKAAILEKAMTAVKSAKKRVQAGTLTYSLAPTATLVQTKAIKQESTPMTYTIAELDEEDRHPAPSRKKHSSVRRHGARNNRNVQLMGHMNFPPSADSMFVRETYDTAGEEAPSRNRNRIRNTNGRGNNGTKHKKPRVTIDMIDLDEDTIEILSEEPAKLKPPVLLRE
jgi:hypothetical protein